MVGYRHNRLWAMCSRIGHEVFIRYDRLRQEEFQMGNLLYRLG